MNPFEYCRIDYEKETESFDYWILFESNMFKIPGIGWMSYSSIECISNGIEYFSITYPFKEHYPKRDIHSFPLLTNIETNQKFYMIGMNNKYWSFHNDKFIWNEYCVGTPKSINIKNSLNPIIVSNKEIRFKRLSKGILKNLSKDIENEISLQDNQMNSLKDNEKEIEYDTLKDNSLKKLSKNSENENSLKNTEKTIEYDILKIIDNNVFWNDEKVNHLRFYQLQKFENNSGIKYVAIVRKDTQVDTTHDIIVNHFKKEIILRKPFEYNLPIRYDYKILTKNINNLSGFLKGIVGSVSFCNNIVFSGICNDLLYKTYFKELTLKLNNFMCSNGFDKIDSLKIIGIGNIYLYKCGINSKDVQIKTNGDNCVLKDCFLNSLELNINVKSRQLSFSNSISYKFLKIIDLDIFSDNVNMVNLFNKSSIEFVNIKFKDSNVNMYQCFFKCESLKKCNIIFRGTNRIINMDSCFRKSSIELFEIKNKMNYNMINYYQTFLDCSNMKYCLIYTNLSSEDIEKQKTFYKATGRIDIKEFI